MANAFDAWKADGAKPDAAEDVASRALSAIVRTAGASADSLLDQSFLSGIADLFELVKNPDQPGAMRFAGRLAHSMTPLSGAQRTVRDAMDSTVRDPAGVTEQFKALAPGLSSSVPARIDRFGQTVTKEGGPMRRALDPFNTSTASSDPVLDELGRLGVRMGMPGGTVTGADLSREQSRGLQMAKGSTTRAALETLIASPRYQALDDLQRAAVVEAVIDRTRDRVQTGVRGRIRGAMVR
jgi:hypothetical protein